MTPKQPLLEPSFADAVHLVEQAADFSAQTKQHWVCSMRKIAHALDKPLEVIPARFSAIRTELRKLHHAPMGVTAKTLANHKANAKSALLWLHKERSLPRHGAPLSAQWARLHSLLSDPSARYRLSPLMRFCSARGIQPDDVDETVIDDFLAYRLQEMARTTNAVTRRVLAKLWNASIGTIDGWPSRELLVPDVKRRSGPAWEDFPIALRRDIEKNYLQGLQKVRRSKNGQRLHPCKPSTIVTRRREFAAVAKKAVSLGVPIETLTSMSSLLNPDLVERVLHQYCAEHGGRPTNFTIELAKHLLSAARTTGCVEEQACERLNELRERLQEYHKKGLTEKNKAFIRKVLSGDNWKRVLRLPTQLMTLARSRRDSAPLGAAVLAQMAVAIGILSVAPIRRGNLTSIRLDTNLTKPGGPDSHYWLGFPDYDVKNKVDLTFKLKSPELNALINEYVHEFRPTLLRGHNEDWLFPGEDGGPKEPTSFATQMGRTIFKHTGLRMTVHQFRHAAGALLLQKYPGNYELVRRVLGHKSVQTTIDFYAEFENWQASEMFEEVVLEHMMEPEGVDQYAYTPRRKPKAMRPALPSRRRVARG